MRSYTSSITSVFVIPSAMRGIHDPHWWDIIFAIQHLHHSIIQFRWVGLPSILSIMIQCVDTFLSFRLVAVIIKDCKIGYTSTIQKIIDGVLGRILVLRFSAWPPFPQYSELVQIHQSSEIQHYSYWSFWWFAKVRFSVLPNQCRAFVKSQIFILKMFWLPCPFYNPP